MEIPRGGHVGFVGESGSGKTLICRSLLGLLPPGVAISAGDVRYDGRDLTALTDREWRGVRGTEIAAVFQDPASYLNPSVRVGHQLAEVLRVRMGHGGGMRSGRRSSCSTGSGCSARTSSTASTRRSSPAGCCSGCSSPSPSPASPTC